MWGAQDRLLFSDGNLHDTLWQTLQRNGTVESIVNEIPRDQFLSTPNTDTIEHIYTRTYIEPLVLFKDRMEANDGETQVDVAGDFLRGLEGHAGPFYIQGHYIELSIPYTGDMRLWDLTPNRYRTTFPRGAVHAPSMQHPGKVVLRFSFPADSLDQDKIRQAIETQISALEFFINASTEQLEAYHSDLRNTISQAVIARKERILQAEGIMDSLGLNLKRNTSAPSFETLQLPRRLVKPLPPSTDYTFNPEPGIDEEEYDHLLRILRHTVRTYETTPSTFTDLGEEELRDLVLAQLNGHYEGGATGETFRKKGKTDIRIEDNQRAAFVAECKVWKGPRSFRDTIDQLLGYLTWRDCKAGILVFNKHNSGFSEIRSKISTELPNHDLAKREIQNQESQAEWRYVFRSSEDELREVTIHVFAVNLFVGDSAKT